MNRSLLLPLALVPLLLLCGVTVAKECTNIPTQLSSHSFRYELLKSNNKTLKQEMFAHYHLTPTDETAWASLFPRKMLREEDDDNDEYGWNMMYKNIKNPGRVRSHASGSFLKEVSLHDVRLDPTSIHWRAQQTNLEYLLMLDVDNLVWNFRKTAGLDAPGQSYLGWEEPRSELRGHFIGHYLSATAHMWASTHDYTLKEKMTSLVSALSECQQKMGTGYLSAFPSEFFDRFEAVQPVWAPYYTIHKILAGLVDQYKLAGNNQALKMATWMADYFYNRVQNVIKKYSVERHWRSLNEETGGMNDILYQLFKITGDSKYLLLAHLFDKPCFLGVLAIQADDISDFHANTHIPIVVGSQQRYEITGDPLYKEISTFFMDTVNSSHSYATGGTSVSEFWKDPKRLADTLQTENEESCTTYNMLKVSRNLFRWTKEVVYADYYERALTNGVLGIQRGTEPGIMIYMLPLGHGVSKAVTGHGWGTLYTSFWCCYGTGIESFSKLGDSIYFEEDGGSPGLYVIQYISSSLEWRSAGVSLVQKVKPVVSWDPYLHVTFNFSKEETGKKSTLNLRIPVWTNSDGAKVSLNGRSLKVPAPGNFLSITQNWKSGDQISMDLPLSIRTEAIKDDRPEYSSLQAILYGPYLLAGHTTREWSYQTQAKAEKWITPIPDSQNNFLVTLTQQSGNSSYVMMNTNQIITLQESPRPGTQEAVHATFRLVNADGSSHGKLSGAEELMGKQVMLEPFDFPGMVVAQASNGSTLAVQDSSSADVEASRFRLVPGVDGKQGTVSLALEGKEGCFVYTDANPKTGTKLRLECGSEASDEKFNQAASFTMYKGISQYHPMSFVMSGAARNFVLSPLFSFRDEYYNVYFSVQT